MINPEIWLFNFSATPTAPIQLQTTQLPANVSRLISSHQVQIVPKKKNCQYVEWSKLLKDLVNNQNK